MENLIIIVLIKYFTGNYNISYTINGYKVNERVKDNYTYIDVNVDKYSYSFKYNLKRNLNLVLQILEIKKEVIVVVNLLDEARKKKIKIDLEELSKDKELTKKHHIEKHRTNEYYQIEEEMCDKLGTKVKITSNKIEIKFSNNKDLNRILEILHLTEE